MKLEQIYQDKLSISNNLSNSFHLFSDVRKFLHREIGNQDLALLRIFMRVMPKRQSANGALPPTTM